jgi:hypothetical protein
MAEDAATLVALGAVALKGRRVNRFFLNETGTKGRYYAGAVAGPAKGKGMFCLIAYDNGDEEEVDAEDLADCLLAPVVAAAPAAAETMSTPKAKAAKGGAAKTPSAAAPVAATPKSTKRKSVAGVASPPPAAAAPQLESPPAAAAGAAATLASAKTRRDRVASPDKMYKGTTRNGVTWKAQLMVHGKLQYKCGFATEEEAARAWNVLAAAQGRTDLNVFPGEKAAAPVVEAAPRAAAAAKLASPAAAKKAPAPPAAPKAAAAPSPPAAKRFKARACRAGACLGLFRRRGDTNARNCARMACPRRSVSRATGVLHAGVARYGARGARGVLLVHRHVRDARALNFSGWAILAGRCCGRTGGSPGRAPARARAAAVWVWVAARRLLRCAMFKAGFDGCCTRRLRRFRAIATRVSGPRRHRGELARLATPDRARHALCASWHLNQPRSRRRAGCAVRWRRTLIPV